MERKIVLRRAVPADAPHIAGHNCAMALESEGLELDHATTLAGVKAVFANPRKGFYLIVEREGEVVGNLMVTEEWSDWRNAVYWWIQSVYLKPVVRGQKLFDRMFGWVMAAAEGAGAREVRLYVERENLRAKRVYERCGMAKSHYDLYEITVNKNDRSQ